MDTERGRDGIRTLGPFLRVWFLFLVVVLQCSLPRM